jgi:Major Facilitator Superfamily
LIVFSLTLYMQQVLNYSALQTRQAFLPQEIAAMVTAPITSHFATRLRFGTKMTLTGSMTLTAMVLLHLSRMPVQGNFVQNLLPGSVIIGFGMVMTFVAVMIAATSGIQDREQGLASELLNTSQWIGAALGLALLSTVSTSRAAARLSQLEGVADAG